MHYTAFCAHRIIENNGITLVLAFVESDGNSVLVDERRFKKNEYIRVRVIKKDIKPL